MRGIGKLMPWTRWVPRRRARARRHPALRAASSRRTRSSPPRSHAHGTACLLGGARSLGAFLTGLYTFRLYFIVFPGEPSAFVEEHHHRHARHGEGPWTMLLPVGVLAVLAIVGGWLQFSPVWTPVTYWLEPAARDARHRGADELAGSPHVRARASRSGSPASASRMRSTARAASGAAPPGAPARARAQALLRRGVRRALLPSRRGARDVAAPCAEEQFVLLGRRRPRADRRSTRAAGSGGCRRACCARTSSSSARHGGDGDRVPGGAMTISSFTSLLIWLPIGAAS